MKDRECANCGIPTLRAGFCCEECERAWLHRSYQLGRVVRVVVWLGLVFVAVAFWIWFCHRIGMI